MSSREPLPHPTLSGEHRVRRTMWNRGSADLSIEPRMRIRLGGSGPPRARRPALGPRSTVGFVVTSPLWKGVPSARAVVRRAIAEAACAVPKTTGEIAVVLTDDTGIRALNRDWRHENAPTNVLAFPAIVGHPRASGRELDEDRR